MPLPNNHCEQNNPFPHSYPIRLKIFWIIFFIAAAHTLIYTGFTANPFLLSDDWYFVEHFLIPFYSDNFNFFSLFDTRGTSDHSQPLHRIIFFSNALFFDLNQRYEAILGSLFLVLTSFVILRHLISVYDKDIDSNEILFIFISILIIFTSFNAKESLIWSLVSLGFIPIFLITVFFIYTSNYIISRKGSIFALLSIAAITLLIGDDTAILALLSSIFVIALNGLIKKELHSFQTIIYILVIIISYKAFLLTISSSASNPNTPTDFINNIYFLINDPINLFTHISSTFFDGYLHNIYSKSLFDIPNSLHILLGTIILFLHIFAWFTFLSPNKNISTLVPYFYMLYGYLLIAAILVFRVPLFGFDYLTSQPRYVRSFQISAWGISIFFVVYWLQLPYLTNSKSFSRYLISLTVLSIVLLTQYNLINNAWETRRYQLAWQRTHAKNILFYAGDEVYGKECKAAKETYPICSMKEERRTRLLRFLKENNMNVFSNQMYYQYVHN